MMKKILIFMSVVLVNFLFVSSVNASLCSDEDQVKIDTEAKNVKVSYEEKQRVMETGTFTPPDDFEGNIEDYVGYEDYLQINLLNLTDNLYAKITNNINDDIVYVSYDMTSDGIYYLDWNNIGTVATLNIEIYSSDKTLCKGEKYNTLTLELPRFNPYYNWNSCENNEEKNVCQKFVFFGNMTIEEFGEKLDLYKETETEENALDKDNNFFEKNLDYFIIGATIIVIASGTVIYIKKRGRK